MGTFDPLAKSLATSITRMFTTSTVRITRVRREVNHSTGTETEVPEGVIDAIASPPLDWKLKDVDGDRVQRQDKRLIVPAQQFTDAGFDIYPASKVDIFVRHRLRTFHVVSVEPISGGDEDAAYKLHLRP